MILCAKPIKPRRTSLYRIQGCFRAAHPSPPRRRIHFRNSLSEINTWDKLSRFDDLKNRFWNSELANARQGELFQKFLPIHERLAEDGIAPSQLYLGCLYWLGKRVPKDMSKAVRYMRAAAYQNVALAQACMGVFFLKGEGVEQDYRSAADWFRQAANQGDAHAQRELGQLYRRGQGVPVDYWQAIQWLQTSWRKR